MATAQSVDWDHQSLEPVFHALPENIELLRLENGVEVVLMRNPGQPMVGIYTQVKVGSAREDSRTSGMSHMLEHLLFNGSEKYTQEELYALTDRVGAYNNANTTDFYTNYMTVLAAAELEAGLDIQSQMLFHSLIPAEKFAKEQGIVLGELVQGRDRPDHDVDTTLRDVIFGGSSLGLPTLGTRSTIAGMQRDDVRAFYKTWYVPNNMILTVAGNFDRKRTLELLEQYYGEVAPGTLPDTQLSPAVHLDRSRSVTRRAGVERAVTLAFEAPTYGMADYFAFLVAADLMTLDGSGILTTALEEREPSVRPAVEVWWEASPGFGRLMIRFTLPEGLEPGMCYPLLQDALAGAMDLGLSDEDILGIVRTAETATLLEREQLRMTGIYISEPLVLGGVDFFVSYLDRLREITAGDVNRVLRQWLVGAPCLAVLLEPAADAVVPTGMPAGMPAGMKMPPGMARAMAAQGGGPDAEMETPDPIPAAPAPLQVDRSELANGAVLVSQTNSGSPLMAIHLAVRGRAIIDSDHAEAGALDLVHRLLPEGYAGCDKTCLARQLRNLGAVVKRYDDPRFPMDNYYTNGRFSFIRVETAAANGPAMLALLTREIQHATFTDEDFTRVRKERTTDLSQGENSARATADRMLTEALYGDHPLALPPEGSAASLGELDFNELRSVYRRAFAAENLVLSVVGPLGHQELKDIIEQQLPGRGRPASGLPPMPVTTAPASLRATVGGQVTAIRLGVLLEVDPADVAALRLVTAILHDRIGMDLRETRGLSYSTGATVGVHGDRAEFEAWINPPSERGDEGLAALREKVTGFDAATITQDEMDRIRSARQGRMMMRRLSSMGQAYYLAMAELDGDLGIYLGALTAYDDLTLADLERVAGRYLADMPLVEVVVD